VPRYVLGYSNCFKFRAEHRTLIYGVLRAQKKNRRHTHYRHHSRVIRVRISATPVNI